MSGVDLSVADGEILAIVGGSGCGKSTLLRLAAGLEATSAGAVRLDGTAIDRPHAQIGLVFQEPRLMPWLSVEENVGFGIEELPRAERRARVSEALARVGLESFARAWPRELSGGMAQRAALARSLVARPRVLLLDEPFSALDALTRADLQDHLLQLWSYDRPTLVLVTHDIDEALALADRVVVMRGRPGRIEAIENISLPRPRDRAAADFQSWRRRLLEHLHASLAKAGPSAEELHPAMAI